MIFGHVSAFAKKPSARRRRKPTIFVFLIVATSALTTADALKDIVEVSCLRKLCAARIICGFFVAFFVPFFCFVDVSLVVRRKPPVAPIRRRQLAGLWNHLFVRSSLAKTAKTCQTRIGNATLPLSLLHDLTSWPLLLTLLVWSVDFVSILFVMPSLTSFIAQSTPKQ